MKLRTLFLSSFITMALLSACNDEDKPSYETKSYIDGIYSNYTDEEFPNLNLVYNNEVKTDKEVTLNTEDYKYCDITFKNVFDTPDVIFRNMEIKNSDNYLTIQKDTTIAGKNIHLDAEIKPEGYEGNYGLEKGSASMKIVITETE